MPWPQKDLAGSSIAVDEPTSGTWTVHHETSGSAAAHSGVHDVDVVHPQRSDLLRISLPKEVRADTALQNRIHAFGRDCSRAPFMRMIGALPHRWRPTASRAQRPPVLSSRVRAMDRRAPVDRRVHAAAPLR